MRVYLVLALTVLMGGCSRPDEGEDGSVSSMGGGTCDPETGVGCGGGGITLCADHPELCLDDGSESDPPIDGGSPIITPLYNGKFDERDFPYTGTCTCTPDASNARATISCMPALTNNACWCSKESDGSFAVRCLGPTDPSYGWTVSPANAFKRPTGNGDVLFIYGDGRNPGAPRPPGYTLTDGTALYFRSCNLNEPTWCVPGESVSVNSSSFSPPRGTAYRLGAWFRSSTAMLSGTDFRHSLQVRIRFYDSGGAEIGSTSAVAPDVAPITSWTEFYTTGTVPSATSSARVEVVVGRTHQSNIYVDDVTFIPL